MSLPVAFVDIETLGLDPVRHAVWEIAVIVDEREHVWQVKLTAEQIAHADPEALEVNGFNQRYQLHKALPPFYVAFQLDRLLEGRHMVGANPRFDEERLRRLCDAELRHGAAPDRYPWHYRCIDVEAMMVARLQAAGESVEIPWKSHGLSERVGVPNDAASEHTALGDARWSKAVFERCMEPLPAVEPFESVRAGWTS